MKRMEFAEGQFIFNQGDRSDHCYQIVSGEVEIRMATRDKAGVKHVHSVARLEYGEIFGEMSIIDDSPRSASAIAAKPTICAAYSAEEIFEMLESDPKQAMDYIRTLIKRLRHTNLQAAAKLSEN